jgi:hypothetical protein
LFDAAGLHVYVIDDDNRIHVRQVNVYRDFGTSVEISSGLEGGEKVALQPPAGIADGQEVTPQAPAQERPS